MPDSLLIVGAGGHGKVVADAALAAGAWSRVAFLDDRLAPGSMVLGLPVLGGAGAMGNFFGEYKLAVVGVGAAGRRLALQRQLAAVGFTIAVIVHPSAAVSKFAVLEPGTVVFAQAAVNADCRVGSACIINTAATVDHDCVLAAAVHVSPGAHLAGNVRVGARTWIGIGASVIQNVAIGDDVTVGAGAVVIRDVRDKATVMGVPAKETGAQS